MDPALVSRHPVGYHQGAAWRRTAEGEIMTRLILAATLVGLSLAADEPPKEDPRKTELEGNWIIVSVQVAGQKVETPAGKVEIRGDSITFKVKGQQEDVKATFKLDPLAKPRTIDTVSPKNQIERGIYELKGNVLRLCVSPPGLDRPLDFVSSPQTRATLLELQREKVEEKPKDQDKDKDKDKAPTRRGRLSAPSAAPRPTTCRCCRRWPRKNRLPRRKPNPRRRRQRGTARDGPPSPATRCSTTSARGRPASSPTGPARPWSTASSAWRW
jgi:uncharacterized protein (TIGR03067 family)